jgi:hypothetical protein
LGHPLGIWSRGSSYLPRLLPPSGARGDHVTRGQGDSYPGWAGGLGAGQAFRDDPAGQIHGGSSRPEGTDSRHRDLGKTVDALDRAAEQLGLFVGRVAGGQAFEGILVDPEAWTETGQT